jgi:hypothetical protein
MLGSGLKPGIMGLRNEMGVVEGEDMVTAGVVKSSVRVSYGKNVGEYLNLSA